MASYHGVTIRRAEARDADEMLRLIKALADYEKLTPPDEAACRRLVNDAFGDRPRFEVFLADLDAQIVGYAFVFETYSTFLALPTLYLEDLFVMPECRGRKAGLALFQHVVSEAERRGCGRVEWVVLDWNQLARDFYNRLDATHLDNWCYYRLEREKFSKVVEAGS